MKVAIVKERSPYEMRVAASVETVKKMIALGLEVIVEKGAGIASAIRDEDYKNAGATLAKDFAAAVQKADIVLKVQRPLSSKEEGIDEVSLLPQEVTMIAMLAPYNTPEQFKNYASRKITAFSLELAPRITRAQSMDVLSSQSNLSGYRAVIEASNLFGRVFPMMMTAAGTVPPARILILGAGVAGLQAIATARRLGAIVSAFDVRAAAKEQVESLGATFISVESEEKGEGTGGYAKEMSADYQKRQAEKIHEAVQKSDIVITTALIPGKPAPRLVTDSMVRDMKEGSVIVDMAVEAGGNVEGSALAQVTEKHGVKICGYANLPSRIARDASALYARNIFNFLNLLWDKEQKKLNINLEDDIIKATAITQKGKIIHPQFASK
ncbi:NAD(P) transhydrogenase subunit alpha part 1 [Caedimonas varicaedens]|jgi:NAD(P) transhydrogenase subunit alpha|uniref:NAD(P) transhydrogenase subunit alpha part 1 n=1 Tax=Caedimonas varicaedens TaxID=1629334 RepID=A0A0K8MC68_9PROT|nr:NAD(P) transhydrogenase subunit alpha part 1 [Caedimonas varicaedens]